MDDRESPLTEAESQWTQLAEQLPRVYAYAYRLCGAEDVAEDLTQQTFLVAQQRFHQLRDPAHLVGWLLRIVRNLFLKSCRRRRPLAASQLDLAVDGIAEVPNVSDCDDERVRMALAGLPEMFRTVVLMYYFEELSYREIADGLGVPVGTVMSRLARARAHLRRLLGSPATEPVASLVAGGVAHD